MSEILSDLRYSKDHEWARLEDDGDVVIGITDHAQELLGDLVFVELPATGREFAVGDTCAVVESVKAASDVYAPIAGEIVAVNELLTDSPELVNGSAFADGWLFKIRPSSPADYEALMDAEGYRDLIESE